MSTENQPATYRRVAILKPGEFIDRSGQPAAFSAADLARIAENYDPLYHSAPVNIDHAEHGPALGVVGDLVFDGEHLLADLSNVPSPVAADLDAGRYPFRSAEVYRDLEGRGPYLRAVALLGARPPAVKGLPPLPAREQSVVAEPKAVGRPTRGAPLQRATKSEPQIIHILTEVYMPTNIEETTAAPAAAVEEGAASTALAEPDVARLAEENLRLATENRGLKRAALKRDIDCFLEGLRRRGQLTPAMELAGVEEALLLSEEQALVVDLADGRQLSLGSLLREVLSALPVCCPATAAANAGLPGNGRSAVSLSEDEQDIARQLGLSEEEFREIKGPA